MIKKIVIFTIILIGIVPQAQALWGLGDILERMLVERCKKQNAQPRVAVEMPIHKKKF